MTQEIFNWIAGLCLLPLLGWAIHVTVTLNSIRDDTKGTPSIIKDNTVAVMALTHYIVWSTEQQTGKSPPPFIPGHDQ